MTSRQNNFFSQWLKERSSSWRPSWCFIYPFTLPLPRVLQLILPQLSKVRISCFGNNKNVNIYGHRTGLRHIMSDQNVFPNLCTWPEPDTMTSIYCILPWKGNYGHHVQRVLMWYPCGWLLLFYEQKSRPRRVTRAPLDVVTVWKSHSTVDAMRVLYVQLQWIWWMKITFVNLCGVPSVWHGQTFYVKTTRWLIPINVATVWMSAMDRDVVPMQRVNYKFVCGIIFAVILNGTLYVSERHIIIVRIQVPLWYMSPLYGFVFGSFLRKRWFIFWKTQWLITFENVFRSKMWSIHHLLFVYS